MRFKFFSNLNIFFSRRAISVVIQTTFPGRLWVGLTEGFEYNQTTVAQVEEAINACLDVAR